MWVRMSLMHAIKFFRYVSKCSIKNVLFFILPNGSTTHRVVDDVLSRSSRGIVYSG